MPRVQPGHPYGTYEIAHFLILGNIKKALGLDQSKVYAFGAAPMQRTTQRYFCSLDMPPLNMYGMSETAGAATSWSFDRSKFNTCGTPIKSVDFKIDKPNKAGEGEICMRGRSIFMGYLKNKEETMKVFDEEGYLHSGDLGMLDEDGFLVITGRIKELIITGGGENVAPVLIETLFKDSC